MSEPIKIVILMKDGFVADVISAGVPVQYVMIDYDTEGADEDELTDVPAIGGYAPTRAFAHRSSADIDGPAVLALHALDIREL